MIDWWGRWTYVSNDPEEEWCDLDYVAHYIENSGYKPILPIERLAEKIVLCYEGYLADTEEEYYGIEENKNNPMINIEDVKLYVEENGGIADFDYE